jgi:hypothetical protein
MRASVISIALAAWLLAFGATQFAFGWNSTPVYPVTNTHSLITTAALSSPIFTTTDNAYGMPLLSMCPGVDWNAVRNYSGEPPTATFHSAVVVNGAYYISSEWEDTRTRSYLDTAGNSPMGNYPGGAVYNWNSLNETTRLQYLTHLAGDTGVPSAWHYPAYEVNQNTGIESAMEQGVATWATVNSVPNTCVLSNPYTGHTYYYTGTISDVINTHHTCVRDNAQWARDNCDTGSWLGAYLGDYLGDKGSYDWAANRGTEMAEMYMRALVADYILAKQLPVIYAGNYVGNLNGSITFDQSTSFDPDAISWRSDATYFQLRGINSQGLTAFCYDINGHQFTSDSNTLTLYASQLLAIGVQPGEQTPYSVTGIDNEGKYHTATGFITVVPEPGSLTLLAIGAAAFFFFLKRKRRP